VPGEVTGARLLSGALLVAAAGFVAFQLLTPLFGYYPNLVQRATHLGFGVVIAVGSLVAARLEAGRRVGWLWVALLLAAGIIWAGVEIIRHYDLYIDDPMQTDTIDTIASVALVLGILVVSGVAVGWAMTALSGIIFVYALAGPWIPGALGHAGFGLDVILQTAYHTTNGIYGDVLGISATTVAVFVIFGVILFEIGAADVLLDLAKWLAGSARGGTAKVALLSSSFFGMINGNATANAASTGSVTIPMMIRSGVPPRLAAAVEAVASSGGQLVPPILGAAAFLMAEFLAVPYLVVAQAAILPALLYYVGAFATIHFEAVKLGLTGIERSQIPMRAHLLRPRRWLPLGFSLGALGTLFGFGYSLEFAGAAGVLAAIASQGILHLTDRAKGTQLLARVHALAAIYRIAIVRAAMVCAQVAVLLACAQILIMFINMTGIGVKVVNGIVGLSGGSLLLGGLLAMVVGLVLGTGLPTTAEYVLAAAVVAPALIKLGADPLAAHMFVYYYAVLATLTPPVGASAFITAGIAKVPWIPVSLTSCRLSLPSFFIPLLFLFHPELITATDEPLKWAVALVTAIAGVFTIMSAVMGVWRAPLRAWERVLAGAGGAALLYPSVIAAAAGVALCVAAYWRQYHNLPTTNDRTEPHAVRKGREA
jgi:TRAP transporter 4TM/12TM fusion protein